MLSEKVMGQIRKMAEEVAAREGCVLYDVEFGGHADGRVLRVFIDKQGSEGVSLDDCSSVSRALNQLLDVEEDLIPGGAYNLEVSSPGLERVLRVRWHFEKALGKTVNVKTFAALQTYNPELTSLGKAKQIKGELTEVREQGLCVTADGAGVFVPFDAITKAHVVFDFDDAKASGKVKPKKGKR